MIPIRSHDFHYLGAVRPPLGERLAIVAELPDGMGSGEIAAAVGAPPTTMSAHLAILSRAGLVSSRKDGRAVIYSAVTAPVAALRGFLEETTRSARD